MAGIPKTTMFALYVLLTLFLHQNLVIAGSKGFSLKIFHRDSKESPLYPGEHLTEEERILRLFRQSKARIQHLGSSKKSGYNLTGSSIDPNFARLPVSFSGSFYLTLIGLGTFQHQGQPDYKMYYLIADTGSDLIWTQCQDCTSCFKQDEPPFPYVASTSYRFLPCNQHPLCDGKCAQAACSYEESYAIGGTTRGILSSERFTVNSDNNAAVSIDGIVFGCGFNQQNFGDYVGHQREHGLPDAITGVLGLGRGARSFVSQLRDSAQGKFSYCLAPWIRGHSWSTYLRFGEAAQFPEGAQVYTTPLLLGIRPTFYYVELNDISVGDLRIGFPPGSFAAGADGKGGVMIDSGTPCTTFPPSKYMFVREAAIRHFASLKLVPRRGGYLGFDLCYDRPADFNRFPVIKFHFPNADFVIEQEAGFFITDSIFCLAMHGDKNSDFSAIIGAWQTTNQRLMFDPFQAKFSFAKEECKINE